MWTAHFLCTERTLCSVEGKIEMQMKQGDEIEAASCAMSETPVRIIMEFM